MSLELLKQEIVKPEYVGLSDQQAADLVNSKTVQRNRIVPIWELKQLAIISGYWPLIKAGQLSENQQLAGLCLSVIDWIEDPKLQTIDVNLPEVQAMIAGLVSFSILTQQQADDVLVLGTETVAWTTANGLPEIGIGYISNVRKELENA